MSKPEDGQRHLEAEIERLAKERDEAVRSAALQQRRRELLEKARRRHVELAQLWHGKYAIVKHENNRLRAKLWSKSEKPHATH